MQVTYDFSGKSVLLIGGTTGIGRATANAFAKAGANLFVAGLGAAQGASLKDEIKALKTGRRRIRRSRRARRQSDGRPAQTGLRAVRPDRRRLQQCRRAGQDRAGPGPGRRRFQSPHGCEPEGHLPGSQASGAAYDRSRRRRDRQHLLAVRRHGLRHDGGLLRQQMGRHRPHQLGRSRSRAQEHPRERHRSRARS